MTGKIWLLLSMLLGWNIIMGQAPNREQMQAMAWEQMPSAIQEFREFLEIPNLSRNKEHQMNNVRWCMDAFQKRGFQTQMLMSGTSPFVFAERKISDPAPTLLVYLQIDGQPVDSSRWAQEDPFIPVLKEKDSEGNWNIIPWNTLSTEIDPEWRIFGRSTSDSKGNGMAFLAALDIIDKEELKPSYNIKVIMDLEEEIGSPNLPQLVKDQKELLASDMLLILDGTRHVSNLPTLTFGARGIAKITMTVFGAKVDLHSGQYGNFAPNPVFGLSRLLAGMKDEEGRVILPGFYDGIELSDEEKALINDIPEDQVQLRDRIGIAKSEAVGATYQEALQYPSLNVRGLRAAWVGDEVRTIIPAKAIAEIDLRLVAESDPERLISVIRQYITDAGYHFVDGTPTDEERKQFPKLIDFDSSISYRAFRTPLDSEIGHFLERALIRAFGTKPVLMRTTGGSQPMSPFIEAMALPAVALRIPNPDNNIHGPNENLRIGNFLEGIQSCLAVLTEEIAK
ncbi:MAG: M20/M25/M40 family metallo-hydrolase [Saprospiraceae bacterium]|nr:M20/M25/M40 family metallo-hydrolase [Saprospiraceae bacterium]